MQFMRGSSLEMAPQSDDGVQRCSARRDRAGNDPAAVQYPAGWKAFPSPALFEVALIAFVPKGRHPKARLYRDLRGPGSLD
jgi:hypothetical protein